MLEKFSNLNIDSSGFGGERTVQVGFGWANDVLLWIAANYGHLLVTLECPSLAADVNGTGSSSGVLPLVSAAVVDHWWDLRLFCRVKRLARMPEDGFLCTDVTVLHVKPSIDFIFVLFRGMALRACSMLFICPCYYCYVYIKQL